MWFENHADTVEGLPDDVSEFTEGVIDECEKLGRKKYDMRDIGIML